MGYIPSELLEMAEKARPKMRVFLKEYLTNKQTKTYKKSDRDDPMMGFAVNAEFIRLVI